MRLATNSVFAVELGHDLQLLGQRTGAKHDWLILAADAEGEVLGVQLAQGSDLPIPDAVIAAARARAIMLYPDRIGEPDHDAIERLVESVPKAPPVAPHVYERDRKNANDPWACKHCPLGAHDPVHIAQKVVQK